MTKVCLSVGDERARTRSLGQILSMRSCSIWKSRDGQFCKRVVNPSEFGNLGASLSSHFSFFVAYPPVELFALQADEVVAWLQDAALGGDGPGRVDVVASHHPHRDACALALPDGIWDLGGEGSGNPARRKEEMKVIFRILCFSSLEVSFYQLPQRE